MKNKAQIERWRGSVVVYVTKQLAVWNAAIRACRV